MLLGPGADKTGRVSGARWDGGGEGSRARLPVGVLVLVKESVRRLGGGRACFLNHDLGQRSDGWSNVGKLAGRMGGRAGGRRLAQQIRY